MANVDFFNVKLVAMFFLMLLKSFVYHHNVFSINLQYAFKNHKDVFLKKN